MKIDKRRLKILRLKQKLYKYDYKTDKYIDGELTEEEFEEVKAQRKIWRAEINRLESLTEEQAIAEGLIIEIKRR